MVLIIAGMALVGIGGIGGYYIATHPFVAPGQVACTLDAKICPDGSSVGRSGPKCEFAQCPAFQPTVTPVPTDSEPGTTIIPGNTATPTVKPVTITPLDTTGWKSVVNAGVKFKIPANATCTNDTQCTEVTYPIVYQGKTQPLPARITITVTGYTGGSRREQYFSLYPGTKECRPIVVESKFGTVDALQIAIDGGWCQGGYVGGTAAVIGNKFVVIGPSLVYDSQKVISRWDIEDTLISTLSVK